METEEKIAKARETHKKSLNVWQNEELELRIDGTGSDKYFLEDTRKKQRHWLS